MKSIDVKSLLIGILGTALVFVLMGQAIVDQKEYEVSCVMDPDPGHVICRRFDSREPFNSSFSNAFIISWQEFSSVLWEPYQD